MLLRKLMLKTAESRALMDRLSRLGMRKGFARRFVAGETIEEALPAVVEMNERGIWATMNLVGESETDEEEIEAATTTYLELLEEIGRREVQSHVSVKPTQLGLCIDEELCRRNLTRIVDRAAELGNFVRIDMEGSAHTEVTLELFRDQYRRRGHHVGIVIQAYLYRSAEDIEEPAASGCNVRLCKGAYKEPPELAFPRKSQVDENYLRLLEKLLLSPAYTAIATHDEAMIRRARRLIERHSIHRDRFEFQMLFGVRRDLQLRLRREGYGMRVYVPFGRDWAPYFVRRLAERPANLFFVLRHLLR